MTYHMMKAMVCKRFAVQDYYWDRTYSAGLTLLNGKAYEVTDSTCHLSHHLEGMTFSSEEEMVKAALATGKFKEI